MTTKMNSLEIPTTPTDQALADMVYWRMNEFNDAVRTALEHGLRVECDLVDHSVMGQCEITLLKASVARPYPRSTNGKR